MLLILLVYLWSVMIACAWLLACCVCLCVSAVLVDCLLVDLCWLCYLVAVC